MIRMTKEGRVRKLEFSGSRKEIAEEIVLIGFAVANIINSYSILPYSSEAMGFLKDIGKVFYEEKEAKWLLRNFNNSSMLRRYGGTVRIDSDSEFLFKHTLAQDELKRRVDKWKITVDENYKVLKIEDLDLPDELNET